MESSEFNIVDIPNKGKTEDGKEETNGDNNNTDNFHIIKIRKCAINRKINSAYQYIHSKTFRKFRNFHTYFKK